MRRRGRLVLVGGLCAAAMAALAGAAAQAAENHCLDAAGREVTQEEPRGDAAECWSLDGTAILSVAASGSYRGYHVTCRARCRYAFGAALYLGPDASYRVPPSDEALTCPAGGVILLPDEVGGVVPGRGGRLDLVPGNLPELVDAFEACLGSNARVSEYRSWVKLDEDGVHLTGAQRLKGRLARDPPDLPLPATVRMKTKLVGTLGSSGLPMAERPPTRRQARLPECGPNLEPTCSVH